jgi:hypothetical protein
MHHQTGVALSIAPAMVSGTLASDRPGIAVSAVFGEHPVGETVLPSVATNVAFFRNAGSKAGMAAWKGRSTVDVTFDVISLMVT